MPARVVADAPEVVVVQVATGALAVVTMTAAVPDDKPARATPMCRPFFFPSYNLRLRSLKTSESNIVRPCSPGWSDLTWTKSLSNAMISILHLANFPVCPEGTIAGY